MTQPLRTVATFTSPWEAHIARGRLEAEGIPATIADGHHIGANWPLSQALGGVKVQVPAEHVAAATQIVAAQRRGDYAAELEDADDAADDERRCPRCGGERVDSRFSTAQLVLEAASLMIAAIFPPRRDEHRCRRCGHRWRT